MNWGKGIFLLYAAFVIMVLGMVVFAMTKEVGLVSDNYYDKEIKYQEQIDREKRTNKIQGDINISYSGQSLIIGFPDGYIKSSPVKGEIYFYRPSDAGKDFKIPLETDAEGKQVMNTAKFDKGIWRIKVSWNKDGQEYYKESVINIQK